MSQLTELQVAASSCSVLYEGIHALRRAFGLLNISSPAVIELESYEEGMKFLSVVVQDNPVFTHVIDKVKGTRHDGVQIMGITIQWPARKIARERIGSQDDAAIAASWSVLKA